VEVPAEVDTQIRMNPAASENSIVRPGALAADAAEVIVVYSLAICGPMLAEVVLFFYIDANAGVSNRAQAQVKT